MGIKKLARWGTSPVDHLVAAFLREKGINPADVQGYTISRSIDDIGTITFSMLFEEESVPPVPHYTPEDEKSD